MTHRFFGYGSLVNLATHDYLTPRPMRVRGWARAWRHTPLRPVAFLTAVPDADAQIDGIAADVPGGDWRALDEREAAYVRQTLPEGAQMYHIPDEAQLSPSTRQPILLSYLDVVVQGYHRVFGAEGVEAFFRTTHGWDAPIRDDRAAPIYPRAQRLTPQETDMVDSAIAALNCRVIRPD